MSVSMELREQQRVCGFDTDMIEQMHTAALDCTSHAGFVDVLKSMTLEMPVLN